MKKKLLAMATMLLVGSMTFVSYAGVWRSDAKHTRGEVLDLAIDKYEDCVMNETGLWGYVEMSDPRYPDIYTGENYSVECMVISSKDGTRVDLTLILDKDRLTLLDLIYH